MSRLTRDGTAETVSRDQILWRERGQQGNIHFPSSADHKQDWQPYPVDPYLCYDDHTYIQTYIHTSASDHFCITHHANMPTCPLQTNTGCGKREAYINWSMVRLAKADPVNGWDGRTRLARPNSLGANEDREISIFPVQLTTCRIDNIITWLIYTLLHTVYVMTIHKISEKQLVHACKV